MSCGHYAPNCLNTPTFIRCGVRFASSALSADHCLGMSHRNTPARSSTEPATSSRTGPIEHIWRVDNMAPPLSINPFASRSGTTIRTSRKPSRQQRPRATAPNCDRLHPPSSPQPSRIISHSRLHPSPNRLPPHCMGPTSASGRPSTLTPCALALPYAPLLAIDAVSHVT